MFGRLDIVALAMTVLLPVLGAMPAAAQLPDPNATGECLIDQQGADDEPGQKDLTEFCEEAPSDNPEELSNSPFELHISWNFDDTRWTGANTGDGCALFDTDGDTFANFALCVTIEDGPPATQISVSPRLYSCGDTRPDRCTSSVSIPNFSSACVANAGTCSNDSSIFCEGNSDCGVGNTCNNVGTQDDDPFQPNTCDTESGRCIADGTVCTSDVDCPNVHSGGGKCNGASCLNQDAHILCWLEANDLPGNEVCDTTVPGGVCTNIAGRQCASDGDCIPITDVCSYPSEQPNSDPSDCIVTPTGQSPCVNVDCSGFNTSCGIASCDPFGADGNCAIVVPKPAGTVCNTGSGDLCDPDEECTGSDAACPADTFAPATTVCNLGTGDICDPDESCTGVADAACPTDTFAPSTTICSQGTDEDCDPDESCTGEADQACPDTVVIDGTSCEDGFACTPGDLCVGGACVSGEPDDTVCPDLDACTEGLCDPANPNADINGCIDSPIPNCLGFVCRTAGFWGTHAGVDPKKLASQNITQAVLDYALVDPVICGELINDTILNTSITSALEALCVSPQGDQKLQLARQLTAMSLNCVMSGGGSDCSLTVNAGEFSAGNAVCLNAVDGDPTDGPTTAEISNRIARIDCLNNGGVLDDLDGVDDVPGICVLGTCPSSPSGFCGGNQDCPLLGETCMPLEDNCHDLPLELDADGNPPPELDFEPPGPAGSQKLCNQAIESACDIFSMSCPVPPAP